MYNIYIEMRYVLLRVRRSIKNVEINVISLSLKCHVVIRIDPLRNVMGTFPVFLLLQHPYPFIILIEASLAA